MAVKRVFDSHFHIFDLQVRDQYPRQNPSHGFPSEQQAAIHRTHLASEAEQTLASAGVNEGVFVQCYNDCPEEVDWVLDQVKDKKFLKGIVAGFDLLDLDKLRQNIEKYSKLTGPKLVGVRHLIDFEEDDFLTRDDLHQGLQVLSDHGLTFDLQSYPQTIKHIPVVAQKLPELKMVIDHIAKPHYHKPEEFSAWCEDMSAAAKYPNVYCKLSGLINEVPDWGVEKFKAYTDHCIKEFGVSRCMYGSDWPVCMLATPKIQYKDVIELLEGLLPPMKDDDKDDIFYNNAKKFYNIE